MICLLTSSTGCGRPQGFINREIYGSRSARRCASVRAARLRQRYLNIPSILLLNRRSSLICVGKPFGSVQIDQAFQREVESRLERIHYESDDHHWSPKFAAHKLTKGDFQAFKLNYGCRVMTALRKRALRIPDLPISYSSPEAGIEDGRIVLEE